MLVQGCRSRATRVGHPLRRFVFFALACLVILWPGQMLAAPSAPLRVRGKATLAATTRARGDALEVRGSLNDDAGRPLADAIVKLGLQAPSGSSRSLPLPETCTPSPAVRRLLGAANLYAITTDSTGASA
jgi:hypothetical protein